MLNKLVTVKEAEVTALHHQCDFAEELWDQVIWGVTVRSFPDLEPLFVKPPTKGEQWMEVKDGILLNTNFHEFYESL